MGIEAVIKKVIAFFMPVFHNDKKQLERRFYQECILYEVEIIQVSQGEAKKKEQINQNEGVMKNQLKDRARYLAKHLDEMEDKDICLNMLYESAVS